MPTEQQAKYGARPSQVSKTAASNPGTKNPPLFLGPRSDKPKKEAPK